MADPEDSAIGTCPGPRIFFLFEGPPTGRGEINVLRLIILLPSQISTVRERGKYFLARGPVRLSGAQGPNAGKDATGYRVQRGSGAVPLAEVQGQSPRRGPGDEKL